jgi:hypothetical protein
VFTTTVYVDYLRAHSVRPGAGTPYDCNEVRKFDGTADDGDYSVLVNGFTVHVYCHNMNETQPRTYVNVKSMTNFAEVYNKRCAVQINWKCSHTPADYSIRSHARTAALVTIHARVQPIAMVIQGEQCSNAFASICTT